MSQQKALLLTEAKGSFAVNTIPIPKPGPGEIVIKVQAAALNPVDWKIQAFDFFVTKYPAVIGNDLAGTVEELGEGVTTFAKGDRIFTQGAINTSEYSAYQQYALAKAEMTAKIPANISSDQAATIPLCFATAAVGLYSSQGGFGLLPSWEDGGRGKYEGKPFVVIGGASSVGQYVIQLAKLSGFSPIISIASPHNADYLKELGATHIVDRSLPADATRAEVAKITSAPIEFVYDAVATPDTQNVAYDLVAPGGMLAIVQHDKIDAAKKTEEKRVEHVFGSFHAPQHRAMGASLYSKITGLLEEGLIRPNRVEVLPNGLQGIIGGLEKLKRGVSNVKLVAHPQETS